MEKNNKMTISVTIYPSILDGVKKRLNGQKVSPLIERLLKDWCDSFDSVVKIQARLELKKVEKIIRDSESKKEEAEKKD